MLYTGRLLNAIIVLVVALCALGLAGSILGKWQESDRKYRLFGLFWLFTALLWFCVTARALAGAMNNYELDQLFFRGAQINVFLSAWFLWGYVTEKLFAKKTLTTIALIIFGILGSLGIYYTSAYPPTLVDETFFLTEYKPIDTALLIFRMNIIPLVLLILGDIAVRLIRLGKGSEKGKSEIMASFSILIYLVLGYFDQAGISGWYILIFRLLFLGSFLMAYLSVSTVLTKSTEEIAIVSRPHIHENP